MALCSLYVPLLLSFYHILTLGFLLSHGLVRPAFSGPSCFVHAKYVDLYHTWNKYIEEWVMMPTVREEEKVLD